MSALFTPPAALLGGHVAHIVLFGGWAVAVAVVLVWPHDRTAHFDPDNQELLTPSRDRTWLQVAALALCTAAATHMAVMPDHFRQSLLYGTFFLGAAATQLAVAWMVLARPSRRILLAAAAGSVAVVAMWAVSRFVGVPIGPDHGATETVGVLDILATAAELVTAVSCLAVLAGRTIRPAWRWTVWSLPLRLTLVALSVGVPITTALAPRG